MKHTAINTPEEIKLEDVASGMCFYEEDSNDYYYDIYNFVDWYIAENGNDENSLDNLPEVLWLTTKEKININASSIVEEACEQLYEDAFDNIDDNDIKELQEFLNNWCAKQTGTTTLYPDYTKYVSVKKEWFR